MAASQAAAKPRARRASRAPMSKSLSVDEGVLAASNSTTYNYPQQAASVASSMVNNATSFFGRPSSMMARTSSSTAALNPTNATAVGLAHRMKSASISTGNKLATSNATAPYKDIDAKPSVNNAGPRRVLGDLSNANKQNNDIRGKDGAKDGAVKPVATRVRSTSSLSSKPLAPKSSTAVSSNSLASVSAASTGFVSAPTAHSRTTSAASRHSHKSSQSSIQGVPTERVRVRTVSSDLQAVSNVPGAPRIGSGSWAKPGLHSRSTSATSTHQVAHANAHVNVIEDGPDNLEEVLDTVDEGDSYSVDNQHGLGITVAGPSSEQDQLNHAHDEEMLDNSDSSGLSVRQDEQSWTAASAAVSKQVTRSGSSNETFELDLDAALDDVAASQDIEQGRRAGQAEYDGMEVDNRTNKKLKRDNSGLNVVSQRPTTSHRSSASNGRLAITPVDPENWLVLREEVQRAAEVKIAQVQRDYKEDLDAWDMSMVAEYSDEIFAYMEELEIASMPNPVYMKEQTEIEWPMRTTLIDWLMQVHMRYHMLPETLWITINIVDRFLSNRVVSLIKLQLVGITAMFVAAKYEEIMAPSVDEFVYMTENNYAREEILKGERIVLQSLEFQISTYCSPYSWVRRISKADDYDIQTRTLSKFLMEVTLLDHRFLRAKPSMVAAVGMYLARRMLDGEWTDAFIYYSKYTESQLATPTSFLLSAISADDFEERFVYQKYASKKFLKASIFARQWAKATLESATRAHELSQK